MIKRHLLGFFFLLATAVMAAAQTSEQAVLSARNQSNDIKARSIELERMKRDADSPHPTEAFGPEFPNIKKDFEQLQLINNRFLTARPSQAALDDSTILKYASQINHRAARLRSNLFPSQNKDQVVSSPQTTIDPSQDIKKLLKILDGSINSFVHSPIFQNQNIVNLNDSLRAQKDLQNVIDISRAIKLKTANGSD